MLVASREEVLLLFGNDRVCVARMTVSGMGPYRPRTASLAGQDKHWRASMGLQGLNPEILSPVGLWISRVNPTDPWDFGKLSTF
jgi:hypothetical protein